MKTAVKDREKMFLCSTPLEEHKYDLKKYFFGLPLNASTAQSLCSVRLLLWYAFKSLSNKQIYHSVLSLNT